MNRADVVEALLRGALSPAEAARATGVEVDEVARWLVHAHRARRAAARRRAFGAAAVCGVALVLGSRLAFSQATCAQTLPPPLVTFCPDAPAHASEVNGNFAGVVSIMNARIGPDAGSVVVNQVETPAPAGPLVLQPSGGATRVGGTLQLTTNTTAACNAGSAGSVRVRGATLEFCSSNTWQPVLTGNLSTPIACRHLLAAAPGLPDGVYTLSAGGYTFQAECDMQGGGWTLIQGRSAERTLESLGVTRNSGTYLPASAVRGLAAMSSQVRFADPGGTATSNANGVAITQLRQLACLNSIGDVAAWTFTGSLNQSHFTSSCGTGYSYPDMFHACGNSGGAHVLTASHTLRSSGPVREVIAIWVR